MQTVISIIIALIIFGILVLIHEFGHFIVAKKCGVVVEEFSVGMGPRIVSRVAKSGTRYSLKALPLGGSCAMLGEDEDNMEEGSFNSKSVWKRMAIVFAGPLFNFILAFVISLIVIGFVGADTPKVTEVSKDSGAYEAGLRKGDLIKDFNDAYVGVGRDLYLEEYVNPIKKGDKVNVKFERKGKTKTIEFDPSHITKYMLGFSHNNGESAPTVMKVEADSALDEAGAKANDVIKKINGTEIKNGNELSAYFVENPMDGTPVKLEIKRGDKLINLTVTPKKTDYYSSGFSYNLKRDKKTFLGVIKYSFIELRYEVNAVLKSLKMLVTGAVSPDEISGPVGIVSVIGDTYKESSKQGAGITILSLLSLAIMLSANLGVMNLLPLPALDGGRLFLYIIEVIIRRPIPKDKEGMIHIVGFILLMALMVFLTFNDIRKLFM